MLSVWAEFGPFLAELAHGDTSNLRRESGVQAISPAMGVTSGRRPVWLASQRGTTGSKGNRSVAVGDGRVGTRLPRETASGTDGRTSANTVQGSMRPA